MASAETVRGAEALRPSAFGFLSAFGHRPSDLGPPVFSVKDIGKGEPQWGGPGCTAIELSVSAAFLTLNRNLTLHLQGFIVPADASKIKMKIKSKNLADQRSANR